MDIASNRKAPTLDRNLIGVVGAGTMGSGIALTALLSDLHVVLFDVQPGMLERARQYIENHLQRKQRSISIKYLALTSNLEDLAGASLVIEAAPEDLAIKADIFSRLEAVCTPRAIFATNTSTLPVTAIAASVSTPERVGGMHFFNPAPVMPLIEVVRAARTSPETLAAIQHMAERMGKTPIITGDTPGFVVNRVARPFYGEALRLLGEQVASHAQIDQIVRVGGGFRMGPFELMDLIGIDINLAATRSIYEQTFHEPRYRPHQIQASMVHQKALGRKSGRGFYRYDPEPPKEEQPPPTQPVPRGMGVLFSAGSWAPGMVEVCRNAGYEITGEIDPGPRRTAMPRLVAGIVTAGKQENARERARRIDLELPPEAPLIIQCVDVTAAEASTWVEHPQRVVGFDGLFFSNGKIATLTPSPRLTRVVHFAVETFIHSLGFQTVWVQDSPALVLPRIVCALANEAAFAAGEGVADPATIDLAMKLGTNYPKGPLAWAEELGPGRVVAVLDHLRTEYGEERYRVAPILRRMARLEAM